MEETLQVFGVVTESMGYKQEDEEALDCYAVEELGDSEQEFSHYRMTWTEGGTVQKLQLRTKFSQLNPRARLNSHPSLWSDSRTFSPLSSWVILYPCFCSWSLPHNSLPK